MHSRSSRGIRKLLFGDLVGGRCNERMNGVRSGSPMSTQLPCREFSGGGAAALAPPPGRRHLDLPNSWRRTTPPDQDIQELIVRLAKEHPRWGYQRVQGELLRLGCGSRHPRSAPPSAVMTGSSARRTATTWRAFLRQQAAGILACDLLHRRHRLAAAAVRAVPASNWTPGGSTWPG